MDIVVDLQYGDSGKGKISKLLADKYNYDSINRYSGSNNSGHHVYHENKLYTLHYLTSGIFKKNRKIIFGAGCYIHPESFLKEIETFDKEFNIKDRIFIDGNCHIITNDHLELDRFNSDGLSNKIGTTGKGTGPCASDKYARKGIIARNVDELKEFIRIPYNFKNWYTYFKGHTCLFEGSQGMNLDIDSKNYPYVTSSHLHPAHIASTFKLPISLINDRFTMIYGIAKVYETYSGHRENFLKRFNVEIEEKISNLGKEIGVTTGRKRQIGILNLDQLIYNINSIGANRVILNKIDILDNINHYELFFEDNNISFKEKKSFIRFIENKIISHCISIDRECILFSGDAKGNDIKI